MLEQVRRRKRHLDRQRNEPTQAPSTPVQRWEAPGRHRASCIIQMEVIGLRKLLNSWNGSLSKPIHHKLLLSGVPKTRCNSNVLPADKYQQRSRYFTLQISRSTLRDEADVMLSCEKKEERNPCINCHLLPAALNTNVMECRELLWQIRQGLSLTHSKTNTTSHFLSFPVTTSAEREHFSSPRQDTFPLADGLYYYCTHTDTQQTHTCLHTHIRAHPCTHTHIRANTDT